MCSLFQYNVIRFIIPSGNSVPMSSCAPLFSAAAADLREDDQESDAKSQDSIDLRDSRASSPPSLHNGKVQYPHPPPHTDADWEGGPPKLERAVSPGSGEEAEPKRVETKAEDSAAVSPADTAEAAVPMEEDKTLSPHSSPQPSPHKVRSPHSDSDQNSNHSAGTKEAGERMETEEAEPSSEDSQKAEAESSSAQRQQGKEEVEGSDVQSPHEKPDSQWEKAGDRNSAAGEKAEVEEESEVEAEQVFPVKVEKMEEESEVKDAKEVSPVKAEVEEESEGKEAEAVSPVKAEKVNDESEVKDTKEVSPVKAEKVEEESEGKEAEAVSPVKAEKVEVKEESEVKKTEQVSPVKAEKADSCHSPADKSPSGKVEQLTMGGKEDDAAQSVSRGKAADVKSEESSAVKKVERSPVKVEDSASVKEEKPEYVKLKEKIIQGEIERLQREKLAKEGVVVDSLSVRTCPFVSSVVLSMSVGVISCQ